MISVSGATFSSREVCQFWRQRLKSFRAIALSLKENEEGIPMNIFNFGWDTEWSMDESELGPLRDWDLTLKCFSFSGWI